jgi:hypothetical protein
MTTPGRTAGPDLLTEARGIPQPPRSSPPTSASRPPPSSPSRQGTSNPTLARVEQHGRRLRHRARAPRQADPHAGDPPAPATSLTADVDATRPRRHTMTGPVVTSRQTLGPPAKPDTKDAATHGQRWVDYVRLNEVEPARANPKDHDVDGIVASLEHHGTGDLMLVDERTGRLVSRPRPPRGPRPRSSPPTPPHPQTASTSTPTATGSSPSSAAGASRRRRPGRRLPRRGQPPHRARRLETPRDRQLPRRPRGPQGPRPPAQSHPHQPRRPPQAAGRQRPAPRPPQAPRQRRNLPTIPEAVLDRLQAAAHQRGVSVSWLAEDLITRGLDLDDGAPATR